MLRTPLQFIVKLDEWLEEGLPGLLVACMAVGITISVFARYLFHAPITGIPELATNAMIWVVFLGSAAVTRRGLHIALDVATNALAPRLQAACAIFASLCTAIILLFLIVWSWRYLDSTHRILPMTSIPLRYIWLALPLGGTLMLLHEFIAICRSIKGLIDGNFEYPNASFGDHFGSDEEFQEEP